jgi:hypothetical protein
VPVLLLTADDGSSWSDRKRTDVDAAAAAIRDVRVEWMTGDHDLHAQHPVAVAELLHRWAP